MPEPHADDLLKETLHHTRLAFETMERLIAASAKGGMDDHIRFRNKILRIRRSPEIPERKKARLIAFGMKKFSLLCRLDDLRNELRGFLGDLESVADAGRVAASDVSFWREEFYQVMAALYVLDHESDDDPQ